MQKPNNHSIEIISIDIINRCHKECPFCYNSSKKDNDGQWSGRDVISFATDCINSGVKCVSLGGGEPFEHPEIFEIIKAIYPLSYLTITSNGLQLTDEGIKDRLKNDHPDKIHLSIHQPGNPDEVNRVIAQLNWLSEIGIATGVNLLVSTKNLLQAKITYN